MLIYFSYSQTATSQAATLGDFPAPISLCAITSLIGVLITVAIEFVNDHHLEVLRPHVAVNALMGYSILVCSLPSYFSLVDILP